MRTATSLFAEPMVHDDQASFSPDGRSLVFAPTRAGGTADLWTLDLGSHKAKALTSGHGGDFCGSPRWYPDSARILAYCVVAQETLDIRRSSTEHTQPTRIVSQHRGHVYGLAR